MKSKHSAFMHTTSAFFKKEPKAIEGEFPRGGKDGMEARDRQIAFNDMNKTGGLNQMNRTTTSKFSGFPRISQNFNKTSNRLMTTDDAGLRISRQTWYRRLCYQFRNYRGSFHARKRKHRKP